jgi:hypothetical protein
VKGFLETIVVRLDELERGLEEVHTAQCGCDMPGKNDYCVAKPREVFRLLADDPTPESFLTLVQLLDQRPRRT